MPSWKSLEKYTELILQLKSCCRVVIQSFKKNLLGLIFDFRKAIEMQVKISTNRLF